MDGRAGCSSQWIDDREKGKFSKNAPLRGDMRNQSESKLELRFVVVLRGPSGLFFPPEQELKVNNFPCPTGKVDLIFRTRYVGLKGFDTAIPRGLWVDVRGSGSSFIKAIEAFSVAARSIAAVISVSTNASIGDLEPELAFNITPGLKKREYFQQFLPEERIRQHSGRKVDMKATFGLLAALAKHPDGDRLHRAAVLYHNALQSWRPGHEIPAIAHLYIGMEALTPIARERYLKQEKMNKDQLAEKWNINKKNIDPEVRRRILFRGDDDCYKTAKDASDSYEHSYRPLPSVRILAATVREKTAHYLRSEIIELAEVEVSCASLLQNPPYDKPLSWDFAKYLWGYLVGETEELAASNQEYPIYIWKSSVKRVHKDDEGGVQVDFEERFSPLVAKGVSFQRSRLELWGPSVDKKIER